MSDAVVKYGGIALVILAAFMVGFFLYRKFYSSSTSGATGAEATPTTPTGKEAPKSGDKQSLQGQQPVVYELQDKDVGPITSKNEKVVMLLYTPTCPHCQKFAREFDKLALNFPNLTFSQMNAQNYGPACQQLGVNRYPTVLLFKNGAQVSTMPGYRKAEEFIADLRKTFNI